MSVYESPHDPYRLETPTEAQRKENPDMTENILKWVWVAIIAYIIWTFVR